ncbi:MAG: Regulatory protein ArsR [Candidatus Amesbacteria bacterium GW2011_GWB1_48_13]|uniref:Regulatory protein ArsR n=1 Tax=Candidatus Amesbacteria bacterium GW2011_GWB1_48_13 TaxID=1618362 RepID=A0A0G1XU92_9BACT|nr:MAG: Regulatory protein ArsR [Candidatus Amesbacteria bacterium GW2011_GWB1_48_13]
MAKTKDIGNKEEFKIAARVYRLLANPKRLEILKNLKEGELGVNDLSGKVGVRKANMSQHLALLRSAGIVNVRHSGVNRYYSLVKPQILDGFDTIIGLNGLNE